MYAIGLLVVFIVGLILWTYLDAKVAAKRKQALYNKVKEED